jgi:uncharacterized LabA/DUF88 family protein
MTGPSHWDHSHGKIVVRKTYKTLIKIDSTNSLPDADSDTDKLRRVLSIDEKIKQRLGKIQNDENALKRTMKQIVETLRKDKDTMQRRFQGWKTVQDTISVCSSRVEFRRAGAITYNLFWKRFGKEKAVDVKLATDLIILRDIYDVAVIVSGDQDYVPAVQVVKDYGKHVINVAFRTKDGKLLPGGAWRLNQHTDDSMEIPYSELAQYLNIPNITTPKLPLKRD